MELRMLQKKGYPVRNLYKIACEPGLWLQAYVNIRANAGALTQGVSTDTIDGFFYRKSREAGKKHCGVENT